MTICLCGSAILRVIDLTASSLFGFPLCKFTEIETLRTKLCSVFYKLTNIRVYPLYVVSQIVVKKTVIYFVFSRNVFNFIASYYMR